MKAIQSIILSLVFLALCFFCFNNVKASVVILNGLSHEITVEAGATQRGEIRIQNAGKKNESVQVYLKDYWYNYLGESLHNDAGTSARSNADWIRFSPEFISLDSSEVATIQYEINVPDTDSIIGTYWSVIMVEGIVPPDTILNKSGVKINTAIRYAIQIITHIGETGKTDLNFMGMELTKNEGVSLVNVAIENTGERMLRAILNLELFNEYGESLGMLNSDRHKFFPGTSVLFQIELAAIKPGNYNGVLVADCGNENMFGTNVSLEIE